MLQALRFLGLIGVYRIGGLVHGFLLVGLVLLLLGLHARDAAVRRAPGQRTKAS